MKKDKKKHLPSFRERTHVLVKNVKSLRVFIICSIKRVVIGLVILPTVHVVLLNFLGVWSHWLVTEFLNVKKPRREDYIAFRPYFVRYGKAWDRIFSLSTLFSLLQAVIMVFFVSGNPQSEGPMVLPTLSNGLILLLCLGSIGSTVFYFSQTSLFEKNKSNAS